MTMIHPFNFLEPERGRTGRGGGGGTGREGPGGEGGGTGREGPGGGSSPATNTTGTH